MELKSAFEKLQTELKIAKQDREADNDLSSKKILEL